MKHEHETKSLYWKNGRRYVAIEEVEYCEKCSSAILVPASDGKDNCIHDFYVVNMLLNDAILKCRKCRLYDFRRIDV